MEDYLLDPARETIEIPVRKVFIAAFLLLPIASSVLMGIFIFRPAAFDISTEDQNGYLAAGIFFSMHFIISLYFGIKFISQFMRDEPGMRVDGNGITYFILGKENGFVAWPDIQRFESNDRRMIRVLLKDPKGYIDRLEVSGLRRLGLRITTLLNKSPIMLNCSMLGITKNKLMDLLTERLALEKQKAR